jgi:hypothetical protein
MTTRHFQAVTSHALGIAVLTALLSAPSARALDGCVRMLQDGNLEERPGTPVGATSSPLRVRISHTPPDPTTADVVTVRVVVTNAGDAESKESALAVDLGGRWSDTFTLRPIAPGATREWTWEWVSELPKGYHLTAAESDLRRDADELVFRAASGAADLVPRLTYEQSSPRPHQGVWLDIEVKNVGEGAACGSRLRLRTGSEIQRLPVPALAPRARHAFRYAVSAPDLTTYPIEVEADVGQVVREVDEANNSATGALHPVRRRTDLVSLGIGPPGPYLSYERLVRRSFALRWGVGYWNAARTSRHREGRPASLTVPAAVSYVTPEFAGLSLEAGVGGVFAMRIGGDTDEGDPMLGDDPRDALSSPTGFAAAGNVGARFARGALILRIAYTPMLGNGVFRSFVDVSAGVEFGRPAGW